MKILLIDNYDSFTYMLRDYLGQCGAECDVVRNDENMEDMLPGAYDAFVISPGPSTPSQSGLLMPFLKKHAADKPVLGICLGHQAIGELFGAKLVKAAIPVHGKEAEIRHTGNPVFDGIPPVFKATRYHSLILEEVIPPLKVIALSSRNEVMAVAHEQLNIWGIQFHPESCLTDHGLRIIQNFLLMAGRKY